MSERATSSSGSEAPSHRDIEDLRRGVAVNYVGYLLKTLHPVLFILVVRAYGAEGFGLFLIAQSVLLFMARLCAIGLDKALLWWVPRQTDEQRRRGIRPVIVVTCTSAVAVSAAIILLSEPLLGLFGGDRSAVAYLRVMACGLIPLVASDVLVHAVMARRHMKAQVIVKETVEPIVLVVTALALHVAGLERLGLAVAFAAAQVAAVVSAVVLFRHDYRDAPAVPAEKPLPPAEMIAYALPTWLSEMANSFLLRMDVYFVAAAMDLRTIGVYGVVRQFGNAIRAIRRSFDPIVLAIVSEIGARKDAQRLASGYSYATFLVTATQLPFFVFLIAFTGWLLPFFGEGFEAGTSAVLILCAFWVVNSCANLAGIVVAGYGYAKLSLVNVIVTIGVQAALLALLVEPHGLEGAAFAVGLSYSVQSVAQMIQMRAITGSWNFRAGVLLPMGLGVIASIPLAVVLLIPGWSSSLWARVAAVGCFAAVYGGGMLALWRARRLPYQSGPTDGAKIGGETAASSA